MTRNDNREQKVPGKRPNMDFDRDQPSENAGSPLHKGGVANEQAQGLRNKPATESATVPGAPEDDRAGDEDAHTRATMPPDQGNDPKRSTM